MEYLIVNKNNYFLEKKILENFDNIVKIVKRKLKVKKNYFFEVHFVSKYMIKKINKEYRHKDKITDVITFSFFNQAHNHNLLGEIFICYDQCLKQAKLYEKTKEREISFIFLHGLLHLFDYDHQTLEDEKVMFDLQKKILKEINL